MEIKKFHEKLKSFDWILFFVLLIILGMSLVTLNSFGMEDGLKSIFFKKQLIWIFISLSLFFLIYFFVNISFLRQSKILIFLFIIFLILFTLLLLFAPKIKGARGWFDLITFSFQPVDFFKIILILILAKYFSKRHIEIYNFKHIIISGLYAFIPFLLVLFQPDFGNAIIIFLIWLGFILISQASKKQLLLIFLFGVLSFLIMWNFVFQPYQKSRIISFLHPLADIQRTGYSAYQSTIAIGSGGLLGKGIGYGNQSRLKFLPERETDFIFASFAEEWGFVGAGLLFSLYFIVFWRIIKNAYLGKDNFEKLFGLGLVIFLGSHFLINIGMNLGLLPVTGVTLPFLSYGGSHLLAEFIGLGILMSMRKKSVLLYDEKQNKEEFLGL